MIIKYSCALCGLYRVDAEVRERADGEDVVVWMEVVGLRASEDHARRSPACHPTTLTEVMIPTDNRPRIGGPVTH